MGTLRLNPVQLSILALGVALTPGLPALAGDVTVRLDASSGFVIEDSTGTIERLRVDEATGNVSRNGALFLHTPGTNNLFVGADAGNPATTGLGGNTAFGDGALFSITTGSGNLAVGAFAGQNQTTGSGNLYLANPGVAEESGRIRIGTTPTHTAAFLAGVHGANVGGSALPVFVNSNGQLGTGGGAPNPWTGNVDAGDNDLTGLRRLAFGPVNETSGGFNIDMPNTSGYGFTIASAESPLWGGIGIARDTTATVGFNWNEGGTNHGTPFNPFLGLSFESNFPTAGWPNDTIQEFHIIAGSGRTTGTVASGAGFAADQVIVVEEPGNGATVGIGILKTIGAGAGATAVIDWMYSETAGTNPPQNGDTMERESSTTVTNRVGTFSTLGGGLWVYPSSTCGPDGETATAILGISSITNQIGTVADLVWVRSSGPGTDVVPGNCVRQSNTGATALLGTISAAATTTFTSAPTATNDGAWRPMTTIFAPHGQGMTSSWFGNRALMESNVPTLRIGTLEFGQTGHWVGIASSVTGPGGNDYVGAIGSASADQNFGIWGRWWIFEPGGYDRVSLGASAITGTKTQDFADVSGTIAAFTDLTGCADGVPVVASGSTGGVRCEPQGFAASLVGVRGGAPAHQLVRQPVAFRSRPDQTLPDGGKLPRESGLTAAEVSAVFPDLVVYDEAGQPLALNSDEMASLLWNEMQKQQETIEEQARAIRRHEQDVAALTKRLARIEARVIAAPGEAQR